MYKDYDNLLGPPYEENKRFPDFGKVSRLSQPGMMKLILLNRWSLPSKMHRKTQSIATK